MSKALKINIFLVVAILTFAADLISKNIAAAGLTEKIEILPFLSLELAKNDAIAFGIPISLFLVIPLSVAILAGAIYVFFRETKDNALAGAAFGLLVGGAAGNLFERIFRGEVIDFVQLGPIPNFNLADAAITVGVLLLIVFYSKIFSTK